MNILERLKLELNNQNYFTDEQYKIFLSENNLNDTEQYKKQMHQRNLLYTVVDILEATSNDIDLMRKISDTNTQFTVESAYKFLKDRIEQIKKKILTLPVEKEEYSNIRPFIVRRW